MPKSHILITCPAFTPFPGGGERYTEQIANRLALRGFRVTVLTSEAEKESDFWQGTKLLDPVKIPIPNPNIIRLPIKPFPGGRKGLLAWRKGMVLLSSLPGTAAGLLGLMAKKIPPIMGYEEVLSQILDDVNLIHGFNISWEYPLLCGWRAAQLMKIPYIVTPFAHLGEATTNRVALNSTMDHQKQVLVNADAMITLTQIEAEGLHKRQASPEMVEVVGAGLDEMTKFEDPQPLVAALSLPEPFFLFIGRSSFDKGAIHAVQAVLSLNKREGPVGLVLAGQDTHEFNRFYNRLTATERRYIRPLGLVDEPTKIALLQSAVALVLPSRTDSFGIVLLEAWANGKPVVAANAGGIPGVVDDGLNGLLVEFGDVPGLAGALQYLLTQPNRAQEMGENGRQKVDKNYNWDTLVNKLISVYNRLLIA